MKRMITVIADNGGGLTLIIGKKWIHSYDNAAHIADDILTYKKERSTRSWEGNEIADYKDAGMPVYDCNTERNGGYRWFSGSPAQVIDQIVSAPEWGYNLSALAQALIDKK